MRFRSIVIMALMWLTGSTAFAREIVPFSTGIAPGTILIRTAERRLYFIVGEGKAVRYPVAVGRPGKQWFGQRAVDGKHVRPAWSPPAEVKRDNPRLPNVIAGGSIR